MDVLLCEWWMGPGVVSEVGDGATGDGDCTRHFQREFDRHQGTACAVLRDLYVPFD